MLQTQIQWITSNENKLRTKKDFERANSMLTEAPALFFRHYGENHGATRSLRNSMVAVALNSRDLDQAEHLLHKNLKIFSAPEGKRDLTWTLYYLDSFGPQLARSSFASRSEARWFARLLNRGSSPGVNRVEVLADGKRLYPKGQASFCAT